jgi:hypothetical protein
MSDRITRLRDVSRSFTEITGRAFRDRFWFRLLVVGVLVGTALSPVIVRSLEQFQYVFVELKISSTERTVARLLFDIGKGYQARESVKVRIEPSVDPERYRFRIPARNVNGLRLDPSHKPGRVEISEAEVLDLSGRRLYRLDLASFQALDEATVLSLADGKLGIEGSDSKNSTARVQIGGKIDLEGQRKGLWSATLFLVVLVTAVSALIAYLLGTSLLRTVLRFFNAAFERIEGSAVSRRRALLIVLLWCGSLSLIVVLSVAGTQKLFHLNHPYFYDPVSYSYLDIVLYLEIKDQPRFSAALKEWFTNSRYPLRTTPLILINPSLLAHPLGHLVTGGAAFFTLLVFSCWTIFRRSGSLLFALAATALLASLPWHFDCRLGLGAYWLDTVSAYFLLLSALALLNWVRGGGLLWVAAFAMFASCTVLARYVSIAYVLFVCGPLLIFAIVKKLRSGSGLRRTLLWPLLISGGIIGALAMPFLIMHLSSNVEYYSKFGYAIGSAPAASFVALANSLLNFHLGIPLLLVLGFMVVTQIMMLRGSSVKHYLTEAGGAFWLAVGMVLCQVFVIRTVDAVHQFGYVALLLSVACLTPVSWPVGIGRKGAIWLTVVAFVSAVAIGVNAAQENRYFAANPSSEEEARKTLNSDLGDALASEGPNVVWAPFFDEYLQMPALETFVRNGVLPGAPSALTFSIHEKYFSSGYPGKSKEEVCDAVLDTLNSGVDIVVVFADLNRVNTSFNNDYSKAVSRCIATEIRRDKRWEEAFRIDSIHYGELIGYRNLH